MEFTVAILVLSDKAAAGIREDRSGPALSEWLSQRQTTVVRCQVIPDDYETIVEVLRDWADTDVCSLLLTCGGTGVAPRDLTPEATLEVSERVIPGFGEQMRAESCKITPMAVLSRAVAGVRKQTLILNLPGSPAAALENLAFVWAAIPHALAKIAGDETDCAGSGR